MDTMDVNMNTSPQDMDISMGTEPEDSLAVPGNDLQGYNDAMEKLCESMKRSAMSRSLVKQLSGSSLRKDGSSRSIGSGISTHPSSSSRQSSARSIHVVSRNSSARSLVKQNSARNGLVQQTSVHSLDDNGISSYPSQRPHPARHSMEAKHRFAPNRAVFRHNSSNAVHGNRPRSDSMNQYDDSGAGLIFDGKNRYS